MHPHQYVSQLHVQNWNQMILSRPIVPQTIPLAPFVASSAKKAINLTMMKLSVRKMEHGAEQYQNANK